MCRTLVSGLGGGSYLLHPLRYKRMLTVNQRDVLAGVITNRYIHEDANYSQWIEEFELHRQRIEETIVEKENDQRTDS